MIRAAALTVLLATVLTGCAAPPSPDPVPAPVAPAAVTAREAPVQVGPVRVRIPAIDVDAAFVDLGLDPTGALAATEDPDVAGWFAAGPAPGDAGPALVAGHVDSRSGPGVFYRLGEVQVGERIEVQRADGTTVAFTVSGRFDTPKAAFPTELVYAPTPGPELRLVTCGGSFDRTTGHYRDNVVVEAVPADGVGWTIS